MVTGGESHPATTRGKLIELEYLTHLENMSQTKRALLVEPAKGVEALEPLAGQGQVVTSQILQNERFLASERIDGVHPKIQGAFVKRDRLKLLRAWQHCKSQVVVPMHKTLVTQSVVCLPIRDADIRTHGAKAVEKIRPKRSHHAQ